jgi:hypothetical protein
MIVAWGFVAGGLCLVAAVWFGVTEGWREGLLFLALALVNLVPAALSVWPQPPTGGRHDARNRR